MTEIDADAFVGSWLAGWNDHDVEAVLAHFSDDVEFVSPVAARLLGGDGVVRGKEALREYWTLGLERIPDLRFDLIDVYEGVGVLVINYRNQAGVLCNEVLELADRVATRGFGTYAIGI